MESPQAEVRYHIVANIVSIEWRNQPDGWFVQMDGSRESLNFGIDRPPWSVGDKIHMTFQRMEDALPSQPPV